MSDRITILRDDVELCDGTVAVADGVPLGDCERMMDILKLPRAATISILDLITRTRTFRVRIYRNHASNDASIRHAIRARQSSPMKADFAIWYEDENADVHKYTATGAAWTRITPQDVIGTAAWLEYDVTCGPLVYTLNDDGIELPYSDALNPEGLGRYLQPDGIYTYRTPSGYEYLQPA